MLSVVGRWKQNTCFSQCAITSIQQLQARTLADFASALKGGELVAVKGAWVESSDTPFWLAELASKPHPARTTIRAPGGDTIAKGTEVVDVCWYKLKDETQLSYTRLLEKDCIATTALVLEPGLEWQRVTGGRSSAAAHFLKQDSYDRVVAHNLSNIK